MPSIVPFGKFFCWFFATTKFLRDSERFHAGQSLSFVQYFGLFAGRDSLARTLDSSELIHEPVAEGLTHERELRAIRQASQIAALATLKIGRAIATKHGHWLP